MNIYPELEGVKMPEALLRDVKFNHTVLQMTSPIAFFAVVEADPGIKRLTPVAIQMDSTPDSKVHTPRDGKDWFLAKSFVQRADFNSLHLIKKRLKVHLYLDAPCTLAEKYFSEFHPIYQLIRQHCRAALETNKLFEIKLFGNDVLLCFQETLCLFVCYFIYEYIYVISMFKARKPKEAYSTYVPKTWEE